MESGDNLTAAPSAAPASISPASPFTKHAPDLIRLGYSPIPRVVRDGEVKPGIIGWSDFCGRQPAPEDLAQWAKIAGADIMLCTGFNGFIAIDIDTDDDPILKAVCAALPHCGVARFGSKGFALLARYAGGPLRTFNIFWADPAVKAPMAEIKGVGANITIPPSIHAKKGWPYQWIDPNDGIMVPGGLPALGALPVITNDDLDHFRQALAPWARKPKEPKPRPEGSIATPSDKRLLAYAETALKNIVAEVAATKAGRNIALFNGACSIGWAVHHRLLSEKVAVEALLEASKRNDAWRDHGRNGCLATIDSGLAKAAGDDLPVLEDRPPQANKQPVRANGVNGTNGSSIPKPVEGIKIAKEIRAEFERDEDEKLYKNEHNVLVAFIKCGVKVSYDEFAHEYKVEGLPGYGPMLNDDSLDELYLLIQREHFLKPTKTDFDRITLAEARRNRFHPVRAYLDGLDWDGMERIDEWLCAYIGAQDDAEGIIRAVGRIFLIAAVRRIRRPGVKFDTMVVIEGPQGTGKSTAIAALCPDPEWFSDSVSLHLETKAVMELTAGKWLVEIGELAGMKRGDVEHVKALLSRQADEARLAYDRMKKRRPRQCIFIGTTNETNYLIDETGNRRFLPVRAGRIDVPALRRDRDQLWAEAAHFEAQGESLMLPRDIQDALKRVQREREIEDEWLNPIHAWLDENFPPQSDPFKDNRTTILAVASSAVSLEKGRLDSVAQKRIAKSLKRCGWAIVSKSNGKNWWGRAKPDETSSEDHFLGATSL